MDETLRDDYTNAALILRFGVAGTYLAARPVGGRHNAWSWMSTVARKSFPWRALPNTKENG